MSDEFKEFRESLGAIVPDSSSNQIKTFMESSVYSDLKKELELWLNERRNYLEEDPKCDSDREVNVTRGQITAIKHFMTVFEVMLMNVLDIEEAYAEKQEELLKEGNNG